MSTTESATGAPSGAPSSGSAGAGAGPDTPPSAAAAAAGPPNPARRTAGAAPLPRPAHRILVEAREAVEPELRAAVATLPPSMQRIAGYHFGWCDAEGRPTEEGGGKVLRPALVLLCAEAVGGSGRAALPAAVAVELVHNFSLLHDDVMDGDTTRRHRATAWTVFGAGPAILAGDALLTLAFQVVAESGLRCAPQGGRLLAGAVQSLIGGQSADLGFESRTDVQLAECARMACDKTGALMSCATGLGGVFGGADPAQTMALHTFGAEMGLAFQIADDLLGIWGDPDSTGKPVHSDLLSRKKTLPVVAALESDTAPAAELAALYRSEAALTRDDTERAAALVDQAGGRRWAVARTTELLESSGRALRAAAPEGPARRELEALARMAARRDT